MSDGIEGIGAIGGNDRELIADRHTQVMQRLEDALQAMEPDMKVVMDAMGPQSAGGLTPQEMMSLTQEKMLLSLQGTGLHHVRFTVLSEVSHAVRRSLTKSLEQTQ